MARFLLVAVVVHLVVFAAANHICSPDDYTITYSACSEGTRTATYKRTADCEGELPAADAQVSCVCTPFDYQPVYKLENGVCKRTYAPSTDCVGGTPGEAEAVEAHLCAVSSVACTADNVQFTYTPCDYGSTPAMMKVLYYFDNKCNPAIGDVAHLLPPMAEAECDRVCGLGEILQGSTCQKCPAGSFSVGGGFRMDSFSNDFFETTKLNFKTSCSFQNATGRFPCQGWHAVNGGLEAGPYDPVNRHTVSECAEKLNGISCHNNLVSELTLSVKLVRDGLVKFAYFVNAEKMYDGLSFLVDGKEVMPQASYEWKDKFVSVELTRGYHDLTWRYTKDEQWSMGTDSATVSYIEVNGTDFNARSCIPCPAGYTSPIGAGECVPCPINSFSSASGSPSCTACPDGQFTLALPRTQCFNRPGCVVSRDATAKYSLCKADGSHTKSYEWLQPQTCRGGESLPAPTSSKCGACAAGRHKVVDTANDRTQCKFCPQGFFSKGNDGECTPCPGGTVGRKVIDYRSFEWYGTSLPENFTTGCDGDCGTPGWRVVNDHLDTGVGHGDEVTVWLRMQVVLEAEGTLEFEYSLDVSSYTDRSLFAYVDDDRVFQNPWDLSLNGKRQKTNPIRLSKGAHVIDWMYEKSGSHDARDTSKDVATIYSIRITFTAAGGADACLQVPEGSFAPPGSSAYEACPAGSYSAAGATECTACPADTYSSKPGSSKAYCLECGAGTSALPGSDKCFVGDAEEPSTFCTFSAASSADPKRRFSYNLLPLEMQQKGHMYGPVFENATDPVREQGHKYYVNVCGQEHLNTSCIDYDGNPLLAFACQETTLRSSETGERVSVNLGNSIALQTIGKGLEGRGLTAVFIGDRCGNGQDRITYLTYVCDPTAGVGHPEGWTEEEWARVHDPKVTSGFNLPGGKLMPVEGKNPGCVYNIVWFSHYACPLCSKADYEAVPVENCANNKRIKYHWKPDALCAPNANIPLPPDEECQPCTINNYIAEEGACRDEQGRHNITYHWVVPKTCNSETGVDLPAPVLAGHCTQNVTIVEAMEVPMLLNVVNVSILVGAAVIISLLGAFSIYTYYRNKRLYSMYSKMMTGDRPGDFQLEDAADFDHITFR
eukprot:jgi/Mesvir1/3243/Mv16385-RA.1